MGLKSKHCSNIRGTFYRRQYKIFPPAGQVRLGLGRGNHKAAITGRTQESAIQCQQVNSAPDTNRGIMLIISFKYLIPGSFPKKLLVAGSAFVILAL